MLVIGAGVNGSVCAAGLQRAGIDVTVLARGTRYEELRRGGIVIEDPFDNRRSVTKVPVIDRLDPDDRYDYVLVVVRKNQVADLLPVLARNRSPNIVFMGNNLSGPDVALIGKLTLKHGCDTYALARSEDDLRLFVDARREAYRVLRALGRRIVPWTEAVIGIMPRFLQVAGLRALLNSRLGEVGLGWHCSQAPDEMRQLALELKALVDQAGLPVPAIRKVLG